MKKYLNVLCVLMLVLMAANIVMPLQMDGKDFNEILQIGRQRGIESSIDGFRMGLMGLMFLMGIPVVVLVVKSFVDFIKFILNINNDKIFVWENVSLLRWAGWGLMSGYIWLFVFSLLIHESIAKFLFNNSDSIMLCLFMLIVAEVFAIGMKIKEEQDLTI